MNVTQQLIVKMETREVRFLKPLLDLVSFYVMQREHGPKLVDFSAALNNEDSQKIISGFYNLRDMAQEVLDKTWPEAEAELAEIIGLAAHKVAEFYINQIEEALSE